MAFTRTLIFLKCGLNPHNGVKERNSCPIQAHLVCAHAGVDQLPILPLKLWSEGVYAQIKANIFHSIISISVLLIWEFWRIWLLLRNSSLTTVANKKQHSVFSGQGEASLPAPNVSKKTWVQRAETAVCQLGSSGPVWLIQRGFCAGIRMFLTFVAPSYVRPSEWDFLPPGSQDASLQFLGTASETPESVTLRWQLTSAGAVPAEDSTDFHRISFKIPKNMLYFSQGRLVMARVELSGLHRNETGGGFWFFWDQDWNPLLAGVKREGDLCVEWL